MEDATSPSTDAQETSTTSSPTEEKFNKLMDDWDSKEEHELNAKKFFAASEVGDITRLKRRYWSILLFLSGIVLALITTTINNYLGLRKAFPFLYCWYDYQKKLEEGDDISNCKTQSNGFTPKYTATQLALKYTYPAFYDFCTFFYIYAPLDIETAKFLVLCIRRFGKKINPYTWSGTSGQRSMLGSEIDQASMDLFAGWFTYVTDKEIYPKDCTTVSVATGNVSNECKNEIWAKWSTSCIPKDDGTFTNPYVPLFPGHSDHFFDVPCVRETIEQQVTPDKIVAHPYSLPSLYEYGLTGIAELAPGFKTSDGSGGVALFNYMFVPKVLADPKPDLADCNANAQLAAWNAAGTFAGAGLSAGGAIGMFAPGPTGQFFGQVGALTGMIGGIAGGMVYGSFVKKQCEESNPPTDSPTQNSPLDAKCLPCYNSEDIMQCQDQCSAQIHRSRKMQDEFNNYKCDTIET